MIPTTLVDHLDFSTRLSRCVKVCHVLGHYRSDSNVGDFTRSLAFGENDIIISPIDLPQAPCVYPASEWSPLLMEFVSMAGTRDSKCLRDVRMSIHQSCSYSSCCSLAKALQDLVWSLHWFPDCNLRWPPSWRWVHKVVVGSRVWSASLIWCCTGFGSGPK